MASPAPAPAWTLGLEVQGQSSPFLRGEGLIWRTEAWRENCLKTWTSGLLDPFPKCSQPARTGFMRQLDKGTGIDSGRARGWEEGARRSSQPGPGPGPGPVLRAGQPHLGWKCGSCSSCYPFMRDFVPERGFYQPKFRYCPCLGVGMGPAGTRWGLDLP